MDSSARGLPVIDFTHFHANPEDPNDVSVARQLLEACSSRGFFYLTGHGIAQAKIDNMFNWSKRFYSLSTEERWPVRRPQKGPEARGWSRPGSGPVTQMLFEPDQVKKAKQNSPTQFELYTCGHSKNPHIKNRLLPDDKLPNFASDVDDYIERCHAVYLLILRAIALGLGSVPVDHFDQFHKGGGESIICLNHYPGGTARDLQSGRMGAHTDYGYLGILFQDECGGLETMDVSRNEYIPVPFVPGAAVINIGDLLARWTNDICISTLHRVRPAFHFQGDAWVPERFSLPFFGSPDRDTIVDPLPGTYGPNRAKKYGPVHGRSHINKRLSVQYENNGLHDD